MAVFRGFPSGRAPNASLASPQQIIDEEQAKGDSYFRQEWLCQFLETAIYALDELTINNLIKQYVAAYKWL